MLPMEICERDVRRSEQNSSKHSKKLGADVERFNKRSCYETLKSRWKFRILVGEEQTKSQISGDI